MEILHKSNFLNVLNTSSYQGMIKGYSGIFRLGEATSTWDADSPVCLVLSILNKHAICQPLSSWFSLIFLEIREFHRQQPSDNVVVLHFFLSFKKIRAYCLFQNRHKKGREGGRERSIALIRQSNWWLANGSKDMGHRDVRGGAGESVTSKLCS